MDRVDHTRIAAMTRRALGETVFDHALNQGRLMGWDQAIAYALEGKEPTPPAGPTPGRPAGDERIAPLTRREGEVAVLVARGLTNRQISERLVISERTADNHVANMLGKLGFSTRAQIAAWAVERELTVGTG